MTATVLKFHRAFRTRLEETYLRLRLQSARHELEKTEELKANAITAAAQWRGHIHELKAHQRERGFAPEDSYTTIDITAFFNLALIAGISACLLAIAFFLWGLHGGL